MANLFDVKQLVHLFQQGKHKIKDQMIKVEVCT